MVAGVGLDVVSAVVLFPDDSDPFFAGRCATDRLTEPFRQRFGEEYAAAVAALVHGRAPASPPSPSPSPRVPPLLDPVDAEPGLLESLRLVEYTLEVPERWRGDDRILICPRVDAGQSTCAGGDYGGGWPVRQTAYVDGGTLEWWLLRFPGLPGDEIGVIGSGPADDLTDGARVTVTSDASVDELLQDRSVLGERIFVDIE